MSGAIFTFHYVSIKSKLTTSYCDTEYYLHSTMYLLNRVPPFVSFTAPVNYLHSTMYLLNPLLLYPNRKCRVDLHSTMYLLNPHICDCQHLVQINLHSTMYLLNQINSVFILCLTRIYIPLCIY